MQPKDPAPGDTPDAWPASAPTDPALPPSAGATRLGGRKRGRLQSRRARLALAMGAGILALLCIGGASLIFVLYDDKTEIERTAPKAVLTSFLGATFVKNNDQEATLYKCASGGDFAQLSQFRDDTKRRELEYSVGITTTWSGITEATAGTESVVSVNLTRTISGGKGRDSTPWKFTLVEQDGWRVCGARRV